MSLTNSLIKKTHCLLMPLVKPEASDLCLIHSNCPAHISRALALGSVTVYDIPFGCSSGEGFWRKGRTSLCTHACEWYAVSSSPSEPISVCKL